MGKLRKWGGEQNYEKYLSYNYYVSSYLFWDEKSVNKKYKFEPKKLAFPTRLGRVQVQRVIN